MSGVGPKIRCLRCKEVVQSRFVHDFVACSCGFEVTACCEAPVVVVADEEVPSYTWTQCPECEVKWPGVFGVAVDGGSVYTRIVGSPDGYEEVEDDPE